MNLEDVSDEDIFFLFQKERCLATLSQPRFEDMFWCSYKVSSVDGAETIIRDKTIWDAVDFEVRDAAGRIPNPHTFAGRVIEFCDGETDRVGFRSLWPPQWQKSRQGFLGRFLNWLRSFF